VGADRGPWLTWIEIRADAHDPATATDFELMVRLRVDVDGSRFFERDWTERILRNRI
jgi:hypothetical protein